MMNLRVLIISDDNKEATSWNAIMKQLEMRADNASTWQILTSPMLADDQDIIIIDTGHEQGDVGLCSMLRPRHSGIILLAGSHPSESHLLAAYAAGADECILKPIGNQLLKAKMKMWQVRLETVLSARCRLSESPLPAPYGSNMPSVIPSYTPRTTWD
jgi:DNA-binding response OmpR family regulator